MNFLIATAVVGIFLIICKKIGDIITAKINKSVDNEVDFYVYKYKQKIKDSNYKIDENIIVAEDQNIVFPKKMPDE